MNVPKLPTHGVWLLALASVACSGSDSDRDRAGAPICQDLASDLQMRVQSMRDPLGCGDSVLPNPPPEGCAGADAFLDRVRVELSGLQSEAGCTRQLVSRDPYIATHSADYARTHDFQAHEIDRDGFTISAREFGRRFASAGPTLVLMHGYPDNQRLYDLVAPILGEQYHTITFDFVGWGESSVPPDGHLYTYDALTRDFEAVLDYFGAIDRVVPVVHDASGWPGIDWALEHEASVEALILLNTVYHPMEETRPPYVIRALSAPEQRARFIEAAGDDELMTRALLRSQVGTFFADDARRDEFLPLFEGNIGTTRPGLYGLTETLLETVIARQANVERMASFRKPVAIVFGAEDPYLNPAVAQSFADAFSESSRLVLVQGAGHYVQLDQAELVAAEIRNTLP